MIKAVIFDFDGVLVESIDIKTMAFAKIFESESRGIIQRIVRHHLDNAGVSRFEKFKYIYKNILQRNLPKEELDSLCDRFSGLAMDAVIKAPYVKGAKEFIDECKGKYKFFIASATPHGEIKKIVKMRKMASYFTGVYGAPEKKSDIVRAILKKQKLLPSEAVYIGDAMSDYGAAFANHVKFIARVPERCTVFKNVDVCKIRDLRALKGVLKRSFIK